MLSEGVITAAVSGIFVLLGILFTNRAARNSEKRRSAEDAAKEASRVQTVAGEQGIERQRILDAATKQAQEVYEGLIAAIRDQLEVQTNALSRVQAEMGAVKAELTAVKDSLRDRDRTVNDLTLQLAGVRAELIEKSRHATIADARITQLEATLRAHGIDVPPEEG